MLRIGWLVHVERLTWHENELGKQSAQIDEVLWVACCARLELFLETFRTGLKMEIFWGWVVSSVSNIRQSASARWCDSVDTARRVCISGDDYTLASVLNSKSQEGQFASNLLKCTLLLSGRVGL